jgi:hypothetical protein
VGRASAAMNSMPQRAAWSNIHWEDGALPQRHLVGEFGCNHLLPDSHSSTFFEQCRNLNSTPRILGI